MDILRILKVEECLDHTMIFEYCFHEPVTEGQIRRLGRGGDLSYFPEFARPFFKLITAGGLQVKGIVGDRSFQVVFPADTGAEGFEAFKNLLASVGTDE